jgi:acetolactate synthase-1/2/3 large subunit
MKFIERADIPVGCTLLGLSVIASDHPLNMGMLGMHGSLATNTKTQECDLLIAIGMRFDDRITGNLNTYAKQAKKIHFDIDPSEINKNVAVDVAVLGNCKQTLSAVTRLLERGNHKQWRDSFKIPAKKEYDIVIKPEVFPESGPIRMGEVVNLVAKATKKEAILVTDVGQNQMISARYFKFKKTRSIVTSGGMGTMGFGLPAAIGATFGAPERTVCLFIGDGGLQMTIEEFGTIMEQQSPVKIILLNNNYLGNVRQWQELFFRKRYSFTPMMNPDYDTLSEAYKIPHETVTDRKHLNSAIDKMLMTKGPYLLQVAVMENGEVLPMCCPGDDVDNMLLEIPNTSKEG